MPLLRKPYLDKRDGCCRRLLIGPGPGPSVVSMPLHGILYSMAVRAQGNQCTPPRLRLRPEPIGLQQLRMSVVKVWKRNIDEGYRRVVARLSRRVQGDPCPGSEPCPTKCGVRIGSSKTLSQSRHCGEPA